MELQSTYFSREQALAFASGLYDIAAIDGLQKEEDEVIRTFLVDCGHGDLSDEAKVTPFELEKAVLLFPTQFGRRLFIKACILVIRVDDHISETEKEALSFMTRAFAPSLTLEELENALAATSL